MPGDLVLEAIRGGVIERDGGYACAPEADIDPRRLQERRGEGLVEIARAHREGDERLGAGLDLRRQHPGRGG